MDEKQVEREVQKTLDLLISTPAIKPRPFFYTRLKTRLQASANPTPVVVRLFHRRIALAVLGIVLLVAINAFSLLRLTSRTMETQEAQAIASFAKEYSISTYRY